METFGRACKQAWSLEDCTYLNHGTVGAPPRAVLQAQRQLMDRIEAHPARFLFRELQAPPGSSPRTSPLFRQAADQVGQFLGAQGEDVAFVDNTTSGVQAILQSFPFHAGDALLIADIGYGGVNKGATYVCRTRGVRLDTCAIELPLQRPGQVVEALEAALTSQTRIALIDHINSNTGLVFPIQAIAELCRSKGVLLLVDGAHAPGSIDLDIESIGCDWFVGNLHKWMWTPRSSAIVWSSKAQQAHLHPPVISWELDQGFTAEFDSIGTRDPSTHLTAPVAIELLKQVGQARRLSWCRERVLQASEALQRRGAVPTGPAEMWSTMGSLFLPEELGAPLAIRQRLFDQGIEAHLSQLQGRTVLRLAAEIYNGPEDFLRLEGALFGINR